MDVLSHLFNFDGGLIKVSLNIWAWICKCASHKSLENYWWTLSINESPGVMSQKLPQCLFGHVQRYPSSSVNYLSDGWDAMHHAQRRRFIPPDSWRKHNVEPNFRNQNHGCWWAKLYVSFHAHQRVPRSNVTKVTTMSLRPCSTLSFFIRQLSQWRMRCHASCPTTALYPSWQLAET